MATILYLTPFSLYRNIHRDVGGKFILPSVLVVRLNENLPFQQPLTILSTKFLRLEKSPYRHETSSQYRGHPGNTYRKRTEQTSFQQPTTTHLFLKSQTWQTEILSHLLLEKTERFQVHKASSGPSEKNPSKWNQHLLTLLLNCFTICVNMWLPECFWKAHSAVYKEAGCHSHRMQVNGNSQSLYSCVKPPEPDFPPYL